MASSTSSPAPVPKEVYTPEVAEHNPTDPLNDDAVKRTSNEGDEGFDTRTIQEAPPLPAVSPALTLNDRRHTVCSRTEMIR